MKSVREALALYLRIGRTYFRWASALLPIAAIVFIPLGLVHAIPVHAHLDSVHTRQGFEVLTLIGAIGVLTATGLIGEVFYTGAVSIALTHPRVGGRPPRVREVARHISYRRLIAVDLAYGFAVALGLVAFVIPGVLLYVYFGLAAPAIEIERHGIVDALRRSLALVRGHFWLVFWVLVPIELVGDALTNLIGSASEHLLSAALPAAWLADTASNILLTPFYAIAAVLLTLDLIAAREGEAPQLHREPAPA